MRIARRVLAVVLGVYTLLITIWIWDGVSGQQTVWLFPALYFLEMLMLSLAAVFIAWTDSPALTKFLWIICGIFLAFVILGALSIGPAYLLSFLLLFLISALSEIQHRGHLLRDLGLGLAGLAGQVGIMLFVIWLSSIMLPVVTR